MAALIQPLSLSIEEKKIIKEYIQTFNWFQEITLEPHELGDAFKLTEILCQVDSLKQKLKCLYAQIPQIVKDEHLVPKLYY